MTVAVYVPGKFLVADKLGVGGYKGIDRNKNKITTVEDKTEGRTHVVLAGIAMMPAFIQVLIKKHFHSTEAKKLDLSERLYKFRDEISPYVGENFEGIIVFDKLGKITAYKLSEKQVSEINDFCAIGSGWYYAEGIYLKDKETLPEDYPFLISQREVTVGSDSDIVTF